MLLTCYRLERDAPPIVPSRQQRGWMDKFPQRQPYRCLPMTIANAYGWELLSPVDFEAEWTGQHAKESIQIRCRDRAEKVQRLVSSHFGGGILTFHTGYLFQTEPDWELFATGPTNDPKDGVGALSGVIESHWLPFPFTMNWQFTRPGVVRWKKDEPFCLIYPVLRNVIEQAEPVVRSIDSNLELKQQYESWRDSRGEFLTGLRNHDADIVKAGWQRHYFRGQRVADGSAAEDHLKKLHPAKPVVLDDREQIDPAFTDRTAGSQTIAPSSYSSSGEGNGSGGRARPIVEKRPPANSLGKFVVHVGEQAARRPSSSEIAPPRASQAASLFICTTPRSGSTYLAQSLESTDVVGRPLEYFDPHFESNWRERLGIAADAEYLPKIRDVGSTANGVFSAKVLFFQLENLSRHVASATRVNDGASPDAWGRVFGPPKFVWLRREDKTLQAISWFRAGKSKQWHRYADVPATEQAEVPEFDSGLISYFKRKLAEYDDAWRAYFDRWKIDVLELVYERFVHDYQTTITRVLQFISPPKLETAKTPAPRYLRLADDITFEMLRRYAEEVPEELARTPLARSEANRLAAEGVKHFRANEFAAAEGKLRAALEWDGISVVLLQNLGAAIASQGRYEESLTYFHRAISINPTSAESFRNAALAFENARRWDEAEAHYRRAAELEPTAVPLRHCLTRLGKLRAQAELEAAVGGDPENVKA
ncbi:MAG: hypothetical protein JNK76_03675 [Planctomycetales bacterium]|nr:hypothetical protein [Planctomycetales bacterium]MBN8625562.1 hypothetical protein [Planctomycetota bacterium]